MNRETLIQEALDLGKDPHTYTASKVYGISESEVTPKQRTLEKSLNFYYLYSSNRSLLLRGKAN